MALGDGRIRGHPTHIDIPQHKRVITKLRSDPFSIDQILHQFLQDQPLAEFPTDSRQALIPRFTLAEHLFSWLEDYTSRPVTPELYWGADPTQPPLYYKSCLVWATVLGRALAISWSMHRRIVIERPRNRISVLTAWPYPIAKRIIDYMYPEADDILEICHRLWETARTVLVQGLFSTEPSTGARYAAAVVLVTASAVIQQGMQIPASKLGHRFVGKGKHWVWWDGKIDPATADEEWDWETLMKKLANAKHLPRGNTDGPHMRALIDSSWGPDSLRYPYDTGEYVSKEALQALDYARLHCFGTVDPQTSGSVAVALASRRDMTCREILETQPFAAQWASTSEEIGAERE